MLSILSTLLLVLGILIFIFSMFLFGMALSLGTTSLVDNDKIIDLTIDVVIKSGPMWLKLLMKIRFVCRYVEKMLEKNIKSIGRKIKMLSIEFIIIGVISLMLSIITIAYASSLNQLNNSMNSALNVTQLINWINKREEAEEAEEEDNWYWDSIPDEEYGDYDGNIPGNIIGSVDNSAENSIYGVELDDGWYYWYHQTSSVDGCTYCGNWSASPWGSQSQHASGNVRPFGKSGCAIYSLAIGFSNVMHKEITPADVLAALDSPIQNGVIVTNSTFFSGRCINARSVIMNRLSERFGAQVVKIGRSTEEIDAVLAQGGVVWNSWVDNTCKWCTGGRLNSDGTPDNSAMHFMCIRKTDGENYYCFTSCRGGNCTSLGGIEGAKATMNYPYNKQSCINSMNCNELWGIINPNKEEISNNDNNGKNVDSDYNRAPDIQFSTDVVNVTIPGAESKTIAWVSDVHVIPDSRQSQANRIAVDFENYKGHTSAELFKNIVRYINTNNIDYAIFGGDIVDQSAEDYYNNGVVQGLSNLKCDYMYLASGHETYIIEGSPSYMNNALNKLGKSTSGIVKKDFNGFSVVGQIMSDDKGNNGIPGSYFNQPTILAVHCPYGDKEGRLDAMTKAYRNRVYNWSTNGDAFPLKGGNLEFANNYLYKESNIYSVVAGHVHKPMTVQLNSRCSEHVFDGSFRCTIGLIKVNGGSKGNSSNNTTNIDKSEQLNTITDAEIKEDIKNGLYTLEDYNYLVALGGESTSYDGFYAVACCVRNRIQRNNTSYKIEVTKSGQFSGYHSSEIGKPRNNDIKRAAIAVLRGGKSTIGSCYYFFGRVTGYDMWADPDITEFYNVGGNIYYNEYGKMHNKQTNKTKGAIVIYDNSKKEWIYPSGSKYTKNN